MRPCEVTITTYDNALKCNTCITHRGVFHQWGQDFIEFDEGPGNYTIAIVELPNGTIIKAEPNCIRFTDKEQL